MAKSEPDLAGSSFWANQFLDILQGFRFLPGGRILAGAGTDKQVTPEGHVGMQAALQPYVDNAISKTINIPHDYPYEKYRLLYEQVYNLELKGFAAFRPNPVNESIL